jgi:pimeloyl-ACP methyl ester carboxylesterase
MPAFRVTIAPILATACSLFGSGCGVAPLVQDAGIEGPSVLATIFDSRSVAATTLDGVTLRGAFVAAPGAAPVVLHLLPSGASVQTGVSIGIGRVGLASSLEALRREGFSSVVFDYRGVGRSDGHPSTGHLLHDGRAMWQEAVRLAGGREDQVIIRAGSLGTLVATGLLDEGAEPGGVIMFAPVRSSTIVRHAIAAEQGRAWALLTSGMYRSLDLPDLEDVAVHSAAPMLVVLPLNDEFLPPHEAEIIATAFDSGGHAVVKFPTDHQTTILRSWNFVVEPDGQSGRLVSELSEAELSFLDNLMPLRTVGTATE